MQTMQEDLQSRMTSFQQRHDAHNEEIAKNKLEFYQMKAEFESRSVRTGLWRNGKKENLTDSGNKRRSLNLLWKDQGTSNRQSKMGLELVIWEKKSSNSKKKGL